MNNAEAAKRLFELPGGVHFDYLFWLAGTKTSDHDLQSELEIMTHEEFLQCFPEKCTLSEFEFDNYKDEGNLADYLKEREIYGFFASVNYPQCFNISLGDDGTPKSWEVTGSLSRVEYVYAETIEELLTKIEATSVLIMNAFIEEEKERGHPLYTMRFS